MNVRIRRIRADVPLPRYETDDAAAFDLAAAEERTVPPGMFLGIFARSSTPLKKGLMVANGVGVVDPDYCGPDDEIKIAVMNFTTAAVTVQRGDRIAQGMFLAVPRVSWEESAELRDASRGGFGATGR